MKRYLCLVSSVLIGVLFLGSVVDARISRVPRRFNMIDFTAGYSQPVGKYDGIVFIDFLDDNNRLVDLDAEDVYNSTYNLSASYGQLRNNHWAFSIGFRYTKVEREDEFLVIGESSDILYAFTVPDLALNQYDIDFNLNYYPMDITRSLFSPYLGVGLSGGLTRASAKGYESELYTDIKTSLNAGLEVVLGRTNRGFFTLASVNSFDFWASGDRPKYLNVGGGIRYYFRP